MDVMVRAVITIKPDDTVAKAVDLFAKHDISALPVVWVASEARSRLHLGCLLVDILLLSIVDAHERFDRFDYALRIPDQIAINIICRQPFSQPPQQTSKVDDFPMRSAHRS
jgi:CBS domain-containing protein